MTTTESNSAVQAVTGVPFVLNGKNLEAEEGELLIEACERNGVHIPRFCHHSRMKPVGMCRMCIVEVDTGRGPSLQPSCMLPVTPEMKVETESEVTKQAQDGVLELLLANHPLDCPVCDKGGECPLQDNAYAYGPGESRFVEEKRHFEKPIPISDLVQLDRERCILCDRCTRFADEVAGDPLIHFIGRGAQTEVNTFPDHPFSSYFSGNTVQVCPVGALTASPYRFKARPWDLSSVESTSAIDGTGARVALQSSENEIVRVLGVDSEAVNWGWLTDKDRFSFQANTNEKRITKPIVADRSEEPANNQKPDLTEAKAGSRHWVDAIAAASEALSVIPERVGIIGGARLSLESQYSWAKLAKGIIGTDNIDAQLGDGLPASLTLGLPKTTIAEMCAPGSIVVLLAADPKEELGSLYIRLRHAVIEDGVKLIELTPRKTSLTKYAKVSVRVSPGSVAKLLSSLPYDGGTDFLDAGQRETLNTMLAGDSPVSVLFGRSNLAESPRFTADALGALHQLNKNTRYLPALRRSNLNGAFEMGLTPGFLPGGVRNSGEVAERFSQLWPVTPSFDGKDTLGILRACANGEIDTLVLVGADPIDDFPDMQMAADAFDTVKNVVAVDCFETASTKRADIFLPATMHGESDGTFCNIEGRLSPLRAKVTAPGQARDDWMIAAELAAGVGPEIGFDTLAELRHEMTQAVTGLAAYDWENANASDDGPVLVNKRNWELDFGEPAPPPGNVTGFRLVVDHKLWDLGTVCQNSPSLSELCEPAALRLNPADAQELDLNSPTSSAAEDDDLGNSFVLVDQGETSHKLRFVLDDTVAKGTVWLPARLAGFDARRLIGTQRPVATVGLRKADIS